jgi:hypothetical protein
MDKYVIDIGETVVCDLCNADYSESDQQGGLLCSSWAICPKCAPDFRETAKKCNEEDTITECPSGLSFRDWVLSLRGGNNTIEISS